MSLDHAFAIPAFGDSPYIAACVESLRTQGSRGSRIVITTSTPSRFLEELAATNRIPLIVNPAQPSIAGDWNFALTASDAKYVTIAHQDDLFCEQYVSTMGAALLRHPDAILAFSNYTEHTASGRRRQNLNMLVKRLLCARAFLGREAISSQAARRRLLTLGNPICCPSVIVNRHKVPDFRFAAGYKTNLDWDAWVRLATEPGSFVHVRQALVSKGIHVDSETSAVIANRTRELEDRQLLERFWPKPMAAIILAMYRQGYVANQV